MFLDNVNANAGVHLILRILIGSYFIAMATNVVPNASGQEFARILLPEAYASYGFSFFIITTSFLVLIGHQVRGAALLLALFLFGSSLYAHFGPDSDGPMVAEFWTDLALIGGLILTYAAPPKARSRRHRLRIGRKIKPRRVRTSEDRENNLIRNEPLARFRFNSVRPKPGFYFQSVHSAATADAAATAPDEAETNAETGEPQPDNNLVNIFSSDTNAA